MHIRTRTHGEDCTALACTALPCTALAHAHVALRRHHSREIPAARSRMYLLYDQLNNPPAATRGASAAAVVVGVVWVVVT